MSKRLQIDIIDLYYQHRVDPNVDIEEVAGAVQDLIKESKVRCWGLSEPGVYRPLQHSIRERAVSLIIAIRQWSNGWGKDGLISNTP